MKHFVTLAVVLFVMVIAQLPARPAFESSDAASGTQSSDTASSGDFSDVMNRDWCLAELRFASGRIEINRDKLLAEGFGDIFTLHFGDTLVSGTGAPNTYRAPYTLAANQAVSIGQMASTLMATFREPEELREHEFFAYLKNAGRWNLSGSNLELHSKKEDGTEAILVFASAR